MLQCCLYMAAMLQAFMLLTHDCSLYSWDEPGRIRWLSWYYNLKFGGILKDVFQPASHFQG